MKWVDIGNGLQEAKFTREEMKEADRYFEMAEKGMTEDEIEAVFEQEKKARHKPHPINESIEHKRVIEDNRKFAEAVKCNYPKLMEKLGE